MKRFKILVVGAVVAVALVAVVAFAVWVALQVIDINGNTVSTAAVTQTNYTVSPTSGIWSAAGIGAGQGAIGRLVVTNSASDPSGRFAITATHTSQPLADGMKAALWDMKNNTAGTCPCVQGINTDGTFIASPYPGCTSPAPTMLYQGTLGALVVGDPAFGQQAGDIALAQGVVKNICFSVMLPLSASPTLAGLTENTKVTLTGDASP